MDGGQISGRICDPSGESWLIGARAFVEIDHTGDGVIDQVVEAETDENGFFKLEGLNQGTYTVHIEKGSFTTTIEVELTGYKYEIPETECAVEPPDIAVISGDYDHIQDIIRTLDLDYDLFPGETMESTYVEFLRDYELMLTYDVIFFNCGINEDWKVYQSEIQENITNFVLQGGSIYASDWAHMFVEATFPEQIDFHGDDHNFEAARVGSEGFVDATVIDENMQTVLGSDRANINFDLASWVIASGIHSEAETLISASVNMYDWSSNLDSTIPNAPLAVRFQAGEGTVIFTSFHNEHQNTTFDMKELLKEIIFSL